MSDVQSLAMCYKVAAYKYDKIEDIEYNAKLLFENFKKLKGVMFNGKSP